MTKPILKPCVECDCEDIKISKLHNEMYEIKCPKCGYTCIDRDYLTTVSAWNKHYLYMNNIEEIKNDSKHTDTERLDWLIDHIWKCAEMVWPRHIIDRRMGKENYERYKNSLEIISDTNKKIKRDKLNAKLSEYGRRCEYDKEFWGDDS